MALRTASDDSGSVLEISDTGIGIPAASLPHVFDRFYRVDAARSREDGGAGLGLSIVRSICTAHGAEVDVESRPRVGSTFRVRFFRRSIVAATMDVHCSSDSGASGAADKVVARADIALPVSASGLAQKGRVRFVRSRTSARSMKRARFLMALLVAGCSTQHSALNPSPDSPAVIYAIPQSQAFAIAHGAIIWRCRPHAVEPMTCISTK